MCLSLLHTVFQALAIQANYQRLRPLMSRAFAGDIGAVLARFCSGNWSLSGAGIV